MMKKLLFVPLFLLFILSFFYVVAQIPPGYYDNAAGLTGTPLRVALHNIIKNHTVVSYSSLWTYFQKTDITPNGKVWDMYSDIPGGIPPYQFTFVTDQCGSYSAEGDCYNKEHSFPSSWFNDADPMHTDLFHIYPTDGWVNNKRGNYPYGDVGTVSWTSLNGSKLGDCNDSGYSGIVFEPIDSFKGDFARSYFYMAVRYYTEDAGWQGSDMVIGAEPKPWALNVLKAWNQLDPVSRKEYDRNDSIYKIQHNRNPFIDKPQWVDSVWNGPASVPENEYDFNKPVIYPNPANDKIFFNYYTVKKENVEVSVFTINGQMIIDENFTKETGNISKSIDLSGVSAGVYYIRFLTNGNSFISKLVIE
ncbi:MAG: endonuclease [Bacteroidales bacterium]